MKGINKLLSEIVSDISGCQYRCQLSNNLKINTAVIHPKKKLVRYSRPFIEAHKNDKEILCDLVKTSINAARSIDESTIYFNYMC